MVGVVAGTVVPGTGRVVGVTEGGRVVVVTVVTEGGRVVVVEVVTEGGRVVVVVVTAVAAELVTSNVQYQP